MQHGEYQQGNKTDQVKQEANHLQPACLKCGDANQLKDGMCERCIDQEKHEALYKCGLSYT